MLVSVSLTCLLVSIMSLFEYVFCVYFSESYVFMLVSLMCVCFTMSYLLMLARIMCLLYEVFCVYFNLVLCFLVGQHLTGS